MQSIAQRSCCQSPLGVAVLIMDAPEVEEHIATSMALSRKLGFNGTPSFVIGENLIPGFVEQPQLQELVKQAREAAD